jgi:ligand-binding sensor domain-containing protein
MRRLYGLLLTIVLLGAAFATAAAQGEEWQLVRPSNTGIPGEEVRLLRFAASGDLWVGARWPFWQEGGVAAYHRDADAWTVLANFETPIPSEYVNDIEFGPGGVMWIATDQGLVRKEGDAWTVFDTSNSPLLHNRIRDIALDSDGDVWINNTNPSDQNAALFEFDGVSWRSFAVPDDLPWPDPWRQLDHVYVDVNDHVWVDNVTLTGVAEYDGTSWVLHGPSLGPFGLITGDAHGHIWLIAGTLGYDVYRYDGMSFVLFGGGTPPLSATTVTDIAIDETGDVYIGNWFGEIVKSTNDGASWSSFSTGTSRVVGLAPDPLGDDLWVATLGGVHHLDGSGTWLRTFNTYNSGMPWYFVDNMMADREGNFWVATGEAGVSRFDGERWRNWGAHNAGSEPWPFLAEQVYGLYQDREGYIWFGSNGIGRWDPATGTLDSWDWQTTPGLWTSIHKYFAEDMNGTVFTVNQDGGVFRFDEAGMTWTPETISSYRTTGMHGMASDSGGNVWVAAWLDLYRWDGSSWTTITEDLGIFDLGGINDLAVGPDDALWIATNGGLLRWDGVTRTLFDTANSPLPARQVQSIAFREDGLMALSAVEFGSATPFPNGVAIIDGDIADPANWTVYRYEDSPLPHYQLGKVAFDADGRLWISAISEAAAVLTLPTTTGVPRSEEAPSGAPSWCENRPNPFGARTEITFRLHQAGHARLSIYDVTGRTVRTLVDATLGAGEHVVALDASDLRSGIFFYRLESGGRQETHRMVHLR